MMDFRDSQTPVRDQGSRPTCAAFASTSAHEALLDHRPDLSAECAVWAGKQHTPGIGDANPVTSVLAGLQTTGHALDAHWPYGDPHHAAGPPPAALESSALGARPAPGGFRVVEPVDLDVVAAALTAGSAVVLSLRHVADAWSAAHRDGWVDADMSAPTFGSHAVVAVGLLAETATRPRAVIVKNSWGAAWGAAGYGYVTERYIHAHANRAVLLEAA